MKIYENKKSFKRIILVLIFIIIIGFCVPKSVRAKDETPVGGKLLNPICDLIVYAGDGIMNIIHSVIYQQSSSTISVDTEAGFWEKIGPWIVGIVSAVIVIGVTIASAGIATAIASAVGVTLGTIGVGTVLLIGTSAGVAAGAIYASNQAPTVINFPVYMVSPEQIFSNKILLFDVDFFNPASSTTAKDQYGQEIKDENGNAVILESTAEKLRSVVSSWYVALRNIALVALLSVLVFIGIRILISTTSNDKAKYKQMLQDWVVAICLLFIMHYIMSFSNMMIKKLIEMVDSTTKDVNYMCFVEDENGKVEEALTQMGLLYTDMKYSEDGHNYIIWQTNLMGKARLDAQWAKGASSSYAGYSIIFLVLVLFTVFFIFTYLKRVLYMAFLTMIAPLVALTYPIDKITDGKAQAFNAWFKEYMFNLLIQPLHLILYTILITSAYELACKNIIYSLVAIGFMIPAEKIMRRFFGFEKAHTPGLLAGPAGAAATMGLMQKLFGKGPKGGKNNSSGKASSESLNGNDSKIKFKDDLGQDAIVDDGEVPLLSDQNGESLNQNDGYGDYLNGLNNPENQGAASNQLEDPSLTDPNYMYMHPDEFDDNGNYIGNNAINNLNLGEGNSIRMVEPNVGNLGDIPRPVQKRSIGRALLRSGSYYGKGVLRKVGKATAQGLSSAPKAAVKFAAGAAVGTTLGAVGLAAGVASGDISNATKYTAAAALGGYKMGSSAANNAINSANVDGVGEQFKRGYYGDEEYQKKQREKYIKQRKSDPEFYNEVLNAVKGNAKEAKRIIKEVSTDYMEYGVLDAKTIVAADKFEKENNLSRKQALATVITVEDYGKGTNKLSAKDSDELNKTLNMRAKARSKDEREAKRKADATRDLLDKYSNIRYK